MHKPFAIRDGIGALGLISVSSLVFSLGFVAAFFPLDFVFMGGVLVGLTSRVEEGAKVEHIQKHHHRFIATLSDTIAIYGKLGSWLAQYKLCWREMFHPPKDPKSKSGLSKARRQIKVT